MSKKISIAIGSVLIIVPLLSIVLMAFMVQWTYPNILPEQWSMASFAIVFKNPGHLFGTIGTSLFLAIGTVIGTLAVAIPAGKAFGCFNFKGKHILRLLLMTPLIVPIVSIAMGIQIGFVPLGLSNSFIGVLILHIVLAIPYALWFITDAFVLVGIKRESQAILLGASRWQVLRHITLPSIFPTLVVAGGFVFIISFSQYFVTMFIGGGKIRTLTMDMFPYVASGERGIGSVYSLLFLAILILSMGVGMVAIRRYYRKGNEVRGND